MIIEKAKKEDYISIYNISKELNVKYNSNKENGVLLRIIPKDFIKDNIENFIVARIDEDIVGFLWSSTEYPIDMLAYTKIIDDIDNCIYCEQIAVKKEFQGQNIGKKLYGFLKNNFKEKGIIVYVNTAPDKNKASLAFHTSIGFNVVGEFYREDFCGFKEYKANLLKLK
ncbi:GNAT family N-acetyltransferase [Anaerosalibacter sp. Marseille-P3206]|uniref:GNAT family N-acetyltransferase n=1 Tax=Anaerosalibacter sp. Marseille-P3206 TaxID=1871005 RepID=UPI000986342A|nr:GNAT family N-acetyltransferase [Anaerosalibacter sp. Marseille-P3206]